MLIAMKVDLKALMSAARKLYELILEEESIVNALDDVEKALNARVSTVTAKRARVTLGTSIGKISIDFGRLSLRIDFNAETWLKLTSP